MFFDAATTQMRADLLIQAINAGKHVYCEKPVADTLDKAMAVAKLAKAKPDAIVMHPGPMNRGVEIESAIADGRQSVILPQVTFGIAVRMAVMAMVAGH